MVAKKKVVKKVESKKLSPVEEKRSEKTSNTTSSIKNENLIPIITHLLGIFVGFLGPLVVLLATKDTNAKNHARKALNWQITYILVSIVVFGLFFIMAFGSMFLAMINPLFMLIYILSFVMMLPIMVLSIVNIVFCIMAAVKANEGTLWNYPFSLPILKTE